MDMGGMTASSSLAVMAMGTATSEGTTMPLSTGTLSSAAAMASSMSMGMGTCKISMLWNWDTIDACFISSTWQIKSRGMFAGSCIGVICLVCALEFLRRMGREYDRFIVLNAQTNSSARLRQYSSLADDSGDSGHNDKTLSSAVAERITECSSNRNEETGGGSSSSSNIRSHFSEKVQHCAPLRPTPPQQLIRAVLHMLQFGVGYFIMLLAMYYNGYIIICILLGALIGSFIFSWDLSAGGISGASHQEASGCCG